MMVVRLPLAIENRSESMGLMNVGFSWNGQASGIPRLRNFRSCVNNRTFDLVSDDMFVDFIKTPRIACNPESESSTAQPE